MKIDKAITASIDIDCQNGFTELCPKELPVPGALEIVDELNAVAKFAAFRIGSKDAHPANALWIATKTKPQFSKIEGYPNLDIRWNAHCVVGTKGFESIDGLPAPENYDFFIYKGIERHMHPYGCAFHDLADKKSTGLIEYLKFNHVETVILNGIATDFCVRTTGLQLSKLFRVILNLAGCRGIAKDTTEAAIKELESRRFSRFMTIESHKELELE
jgi:nicotinamidase/pyrazinamidase